MTGPTSQDVGERFEKDGGFGKKHCPDRAVGTLIQCPWLTGEGGICESSGRKAYNDPCERISKYLRGE